MKNRILRTGSVPGYAHKQKSKNGQDAYMAAELAFGSSTFSFGVVFDGCTGKKKGIQSVTEVGAQLMAAFFRSEIPLILAAHTPIRDVPDILYQRSIGYLGSIARSTVMGEPNTMWEFVQRYLLCTVLGYISDGTDLVVFSAGDGVVFVNDNINVIDQNDKPIYLAYHLLDKRLIGDLKLPNTFHTMEFALSDVKRFAVSTDGVVKNAIKDPAYVDGIWNYEPSTRAGLQWHLNIGANASRFEDDCTVIAFGGATPTSGELVDAS